MSHLLEEGVSIIIPTYNRKKFEKLIEYNILIQTYPYIKEIIIGDDGDDEPICLRIPYPIHYHRLPRLSIGQKRNYLISKATGKYIINMDTDDFYSKEYISTSIFTLIDNDKECCGSADMLIFNGTDYYKQSCMFLYLLNEATICMTRAMWETTNGYAIQNSSEGADLIKSNIKKVCETKEMLMCCVGHKSNTIDKSIWYKDIYKSETNNEYINHIKIISTLNIYDAILPTSITSKRDA